MGEHDLIVVTGASGFIAKHVMANLLNSGNRVRGTLRNEAKAESVEAAMEIMCGPDALSRLELVTCDLLSDSGWHKAMEGADAVLHLATYVPAKEPKDPQDVIRPALEGTERVFKFAHKANISRIIMTSSIAAIGYGHNDKRTTVGLSAKDWTSIKGLNGAWAYPEAKTLAELRAWELAQSLQLDLTCICPSMVFGPAIDADMSASLKVIKQLISGQTPALPPGGISIVDVRDVAQIHVDALKNDDTIDERIIASSTYQSFVDIAQVLRLAYPDIRIPSRVVPKWIMLLVARFSPMIKQIVADLKVVRHYDGRPATDLMGRDYRRADEAILSAAESMIELGVVSHS